MRVYIIFIFILLSSSLIYSQDENIKLGKDPTIPAGAVYDLSDPMGINMEVSLLGFIRNPGRYKVPVKTTLLDVLSFAGGPLEYSNLEEIRLIHTDSTGAFKKIIKLNYNDLMWEDEVHMDTKRNPVLMPGDIIIMMQKIRRSFYDIMLLVIPIITTVLSLATFIITVRK